MLNRANKTFVGRKSELREFRKVAKNPYGGVRVLFLVGSGGIGKTKIVEKIIEEARKLEKTKQSRVLVPNILFDFSATELRSIDGIQSKIVEAVEKTTKLVGEKSPFAEFSKKGQNTSEQFNADLRKFCAKTPLLLVFDTLEMLGTVAMNWIFEDGNEGLQVPGLVCVVAGRPEKEVNINLEKYKSKFHVNVCWIEGLSLLETVEFYDKVSNELNFESQNDLSLQAGLSESNFSSRNLQKYLEQVHKLTNGHPLQVEMAIRWVVSNETAPNVGEDFQGLNTENFEEKLMRKVDYDGEDWFLKSGSPDSNRAVFETLLCMGHITRRFDENLLRFLTAKGFIPRGKSKVTDKQILENLEKYFFVKTREGDKSGRVFQLHDEMARLVRKHLWRGSDLVEEKKNRLLTAVIKFYDQLIRISQKDKTLQKTLQIEQLFYTLQRNVEEGKRLWLDLADLNDPYINSLLPSEINEYKAAFGPTSRYEIHYWVADLELSENHINQAKREWEQVKKLGEEENQPVWIINALLGLASCERNPAKALEVLEEANVLSEKYASEYLPSVKYYMGFTYRRKQDIENAIIWYKKAREDFRRNSDDKFLGARISNDLGYAHSQVGEWEECLDNLKEGQRIRQNLVDQFENEVQDLKKSLKEPGNKVNRELLKNALKRAEANLSKARFQLGLSFNTLGEIYRFRDDTPASLRNYTYAIKLFTKESRHNWHVRALFSRSETHRRSAWKKYREGNKEEFLRENTLAENDCSESLFLCRKYRVRDERDTAHRRMGRILHDQALYALERKKDFKKARELLDSAGDYFDTGLWYARDTHDILEELSNLTELAFIYDDYLRLPRGKKAAQRYKGALDELKHVLDRHRNKPNRIYQFEVFDNIYEMEKAAVEYQEGKYDVALKGYLKAYSALAADPGYGRVKYRSLFSHLVAQIEDLSEKDAVAWCKAFIRQWEEEPVVIRGRKTTLAKEDRIFPDMVQWCWEKLKTLKTTETKASSLAGTNASLPDSKEKNKRKG